MRKLLLPVVALAAAGGATYLARSYLEAGRAAAPPPAAAAPARPATKGVLVAAKALSVGQFVEPADVRWQQWPDVGLPESYLVEGQRSMDEVVGAVMRRPATEGEPITLDTVVKPGDRGFLAAVLDPDMRAVSVPVDDASSNAGLIFPGDRVDLILTQALGKDEGGDAPTRRVSETVLRDVRVLAMGRRLSSGDDEAGGGAARGDARTATLEVTPAGAEQVALVTELGKLSLSLRSLARRDPAGDGPPEPGFRVTWDDDVSPVLRPENQPRTTMAVVRGGETVNLSIPRGVAP
jgi:pilus assembly protein CpaB